MAGLKPIRRVVTGTDAQGRSKIAWDGPAPNAHESSMGSGRGHTDLWVWETASQWLARDSDDGNRPYDFPGPPLGGHLRVVQARGRLPDYDAAKDPDLVPAHPPRTRDPSMAVHPSPPRRDNPRRSGHQKEYRRGRPAIHAR